MDKVEEAKKLLEAEGKKKQEAFLKDYEVLVKKHGLQLQPVAGLNIVNIQNEK